MPDVFVPMEGKHGDEAVNMIMQSGIVSYFVFEQLDKERKQFQGLPVAQLSEKVTAGDKYYRAFTNYLTRNNLVFNLDRHKEKIKRFLAAEFARQLFDDKVYYQMALKEDNMVRTVLEQKKK
jgi:carboxyl-terminal processing protease